MILPVTQSVQSAPLKGDRPIIFFDGECVMCNGFVDIMLRLDPNARILMAPLQGEIAKEVLPPLPVNRKEWTIYFLDESGLYCRSEAFIRICKRLNNWVSILGITGMVPLPIRDGIYNFIASNRYSFFGRKPNCRIPSASEQEHFLP